MAELSGKLAVVTGAGSGIGRALALQLVEAGAELALGDLNAVTLAESVALCQRRRAAATITSMVVDVSDRGALNEFAAAVARAHRTNSIDLLFNNAGVGGGASFLMDDEAEWDRTFDISWGGTYRTTRAFLPMLVASTSANIVNISSINAVWAELGAGTPVNAYATAKFAVKGFTEALQTDLQVYAPHVRATLVMPGSVSSSISANTASIHGRQPLQLSADQLAAERRRFHAQGVDVTAFDDDTLRLRLHEWSGDLERRALLTPDQAASQILDGLRAGKWRIVVGSEAIALDRVMRLFPTRAYRWSNKRLNLHVAMAAPIRIGKAVGPILLDRVRSTGAKHQRGREPVATLTRTALITGASTGIGAATARRLDELGWRVFAGVRRAEDGERLTEGASERLRWVLLDVADEAQIHVALATVADQLGDGGLDALINNAGVSFSGPIEILPLDQWRRQFEVNVVGQVAVTKVALPLLRRNVGRVVFISSLSGRVAPAYLGPYAASKFAVEAIGMSLRKELMPWGMRVAVIEPGVIDTPIWHKSPDPAEFEDMVGTEQFDIYRPYLVPLQGIVEKQLRAGAPMSAATDAIVHALTSAHPKHRYLVGQDAKLLGGMYRYLPDRVAAKAERLLWRFKG
jgi:NAD(P)-dependent dehydrogenase (short-subunit alcohol dehydrogenase family)